MKIDIVEKLTPHMTEALVRLWEASVRATHDFLTESEIGRIGAYVPEGCKASVILPSRGRKTAPPRRFRA